VARLTGESAMMLREQSMDGSFNPNLGSPPVNYRFAAPSSAPKASPALRTWVKFVTCTPLSPARVAGTVGVDIDHWRAVPVQIRPAVGLPPTGC